MEESELLKAIEKRREKQSDESVAAFDAFVALWSVHVGNPRLFVLQLHKLIKVCKDNERGRIIKLIDENKEAPPLNVFYSGFNEALDTIKAQIEAKDEDGHEQK